MKLSTKYFSFRNRLVVIVVGVTLGAVSLLYTNNMAQRLKWKEQHDVALWAHAIERVSRDVLGGTIQDPLVTDIMSNGNNIPFIITNENLEVINSHLVPDKIIDHPDRLRKQIDKFTQENTPIPVNFLWSSQHYHIIFYGQSALLKSLYYFPYVQLLVITAFIALGFIAFRSSKHDEQNRVWIGLAKETAHQLGTPISSLMAWVEILRENYPDDDLIPEMDKDVKRLQLIADRFSKIGSLPEPVPVSLDTTLSHVVDYMDRRTSRRVVISVSHTQGDQTVNLNASLFEWVIENLCKNAVDAMGGDGGKIAITTGTSPKGVWIEVADTGKGIPKKDVGNVFRPGFTTKRRGWGLGLSLAKRIVEEYHHGRIYVKSSEPGVGTVFRIELRQC